MNEQVDYLSGKYPTRASANASFNKSEVLQLLKDYKPKQLENATEVIKLVLRKFYYGDEQAVGYEELNVKLKDWMCEEIGHEEFVDFAEKVILS